MNDLVNMLLLPESLTSMIHTGGPVVLILLILSVFVMTVIVLKIVQFLFSGMIFRRSTNAEIKLWISGQREEAYRRVSKRKNPTAKVLTHLMRGLGNSDVTEAVVREDVERVATQHLSNVRSYFKAIEAVVQIAPLLGLFGTVIGMIEAFQKLQSVGSEVDPSVLAGGIWVALLTTAVGLAVAIPSALILYWFEAIAQREQENIEIAVTSILTKCATDETYQSKNNSVLSDNVKSITDAA